MESIEKPMQCMDIHETCENQWRSNKSVDAWEGGWDTGNPTMDFNGRLGPGYYARLEAHDGNQPYNDRNPTMETDPIMVDLGTGSSC